MIVAVTGASGFIGARVVMRLAQEGHRVLAFGRRPASDFALNEYAEYRVWDITDGPIDLRYRVDAVVHSSGKVGDWGSYEDYYRANVACTATVLETFRSAPSFVYLSSASVYNPFVPRVGVREDSSFASHYLNHYSYTKMAAERLIAQRRQSAVVLRPSAVYGDGDRIFLPRLLQARRAGRLLAVGDGRNRISLTHVDTLVDAVSLAVGRRSGREVFNVADELTPSVGEILQGLLTALSLPESLFYIPTRTAWALASLLEVAYVAMGRDHPPLVTRFAVAQMGQENTLDTSRAQKLLGLRATRSYVDWFRDLSGSLMNNSQPPSTPA